MRNSRSKIFLCLVASMLMTTLGCSPSVEYFDEMEMLPTKETLFEFSLGHHRMPVPAELPEEGVQWAHGNNLHIEFDLHALVPPSYVKDLNKAWKRQEGSFRNDVIKACRRTSLDELTEPDLITLKGQLTELAMRRFGRKRIRRLVLTDVSFQLL